MELQDVTNVSPGQQFDPLPRLLEEIEKENTSSVYYETGKRTIDIIGSFLLLLFLSPLLLIIALGVKLTSKGPVFFRQERVGKNGKTFTFIKFRTMKHNNDNSIHREYVHKLIKGDVDDINHGTDEEPLFKIKNDPRVTEFGSFLRKTSLDEIPQLINVLSGSMSLVGPRPPIPYEVEAYKSWHLKRLSVKPGVTGLWQVSGRSNTTFDEMVKMDIEYIAQRTVAQDLRILFMTVPAALNTSTAV